MVVITIGGLPGSGTTTVARIVSRKLSLKYVYTGDIFRNLAKEHKMELLEFGKYADEHPEIDRELDRRQAELARAGNVLLEGRMAGWAVHNARIPAIKVWLDAPLDIRVGRVGKREKKGPDTIKNEVQTRELGERARYLKIYNFDLNAKSIYDLVIDTSNLTPDEIAKKIIERVEKENPIGCEG